MPLRGLGTNPAHCLHAGPFFLAAWNSDPWLSLNHEHCKAFFIKPGEHLSSEAMCECTAVHLHIHTQKMPFFGGWGEVGGGWEIKSYFPTHKKPLSFQEGAQDWLSQEELFDIILSLLRPSSCLPLHSLLLSQKLADVSSNDSSDSLETRFLSILCTRSYPHLRKGRTTFLHCCWTLSCSASALAGLVGLVGSNRLRLPQG